MAIKETFAGHIMPMHEKVTPEEISAFFEGSDPMQHIICIELGYRDNVAEIVFVDENNVKKIRR